MRQVILDTETTGLDPGKGHRVIEIGLIEVVHRRRTGNHFHRYLNPDRESDPGALQKHGLTTEFLADKPRFGDIAQEFLAFVEGAELIIHNAAFDVGFLDHELEMLQLGAVMQVCPKVIDTLALARELHPGKRNTLDALCERYGVDNSHRKFHGALLDAELLADVYLAMTRGQEMLAMEEGAQSHSDDHEQAGFTLSQPLRVIRADTAELEAHHRQIELIDRQSGGKCCWKLSEPAT